MERELWQKNDRQKLPPLIAAILFLSIFFYLALPKAGIKVAEIPISVGDVLFLILIIFCLTRVKYWPATFNNFKIIITLLIFSMGFAFLKLSYAYLNNGSFNAGVFVPLIIYPLIFFILLLIYLHYEISWKKLLLIPLIAFIFLSVYALLQLFLGIETVMIPGLTYNWTDAQNPLIMMTKYNYYGYYTKIFATYQNGNIFGVNLLLIFPLVFELVYRRSKNSAYLALVFFITIAFLTASRAVWAGVIFYVLVRFFLLTKSWGKLTVLFPLSFISTLIIFVEPLRFRANMFLGKDKIPQLIKLQTVEKTIERAGGGGKIWAQETANMPPQIEDLSGREDTINRLWDATFGTLNWEAILLGPYGILPKRSFGISGETVYIALFTYLGLVGLIIWSLPVLFSLYIFINHRNDFLMRGILLGLVTYFLVAIVEGAYWLAPTAFNLWLMLSLGWARQHFLQTNKKYNP